ncbi:MAG: C45 family autoproteolytic acyltransferase/hydrolase [Bacteroidota bacterium]
MSESASEKYKWLGSNYQRILNYHAAHDIGHALQNMALVGCTSFGTWDARSQDSTMIIGRNFDFYVGDKFAEDKIVAFFNPAQGYKFMTVTWGGFIGAVSGMNEKGITVTINAAKSSTPHRFRHSRFISSQGNTAVCEKYCRSPYKLPGAERCLYLNHSLWVRQQIIKQ